MNHNEDVAFNSLKIASNEESFGINSGSLIVNGGISCKKSINCKNLINDCLINKKSAKFENDVTISKNLKVNIITVNNNDEISSIGTPDNRFNDIYSTNMDSNNIYVNNLASINTLKSNYFKVNNSAEIGKNDEGKIMIDVNDNNNTITINSDLFKIRNNNEMSIEVENNLFFINTLIKYKFSNIYISDRNFNLNPESSIILINSCIQNPEISLMVNKSILTPEIFENGTFIRIFNKSKKYCIIVENYILPSNSFIEFIMIDCEWIILRNDSSENDSFRTYRSAQTEGNIECSSESLNDCDTSSNFSKDQDDNNYIPNTNNCKIIKRLKKSKYEKKCNNDKKCDDENVCKQIINSDNENSTSFEVYN